MIVFEKVLDKIDEWHDRAQDWGRTSPSRDLLVALSMWLWAIPFAFVIMGVVAIIGLSFCWAMGLLLGI